MPGEMNIDQIAEIQRLTTDFQEIFDAQMAIPCLTTPNDSLEGLKPLEAIEEGKIDRIWQMIYEPRSGSPI